MASVPTRRFTIRDMAILVALVACSIVSIKKVDQDLGAWRDFPPLDILSRCVVLSYECLNRMLIPWAPGVLLMRLARPRPSRARLWRQPGFVASVAATAATGLEIIHSFAVFCYSQKDGSFWNYFWYIQHDEIKSAVFGAWVILILSRRWRSEACWDDRLGRGIGYLWVGLFLSAPIEWYLR